MSLFDRLQSLFARNSKPARRQRTLQQRRTFLESLEDRRLMVATPARFDFGPATQTPAAGYTAVAHDTAYTSTLGYGWTTVGDAGQVSSTQNIADPLKTDFVRGFQPNTFKTLVPYGTYDLVLTTGHDQFATNNTQVSIGGAVVDTFSTAIGQYHNRSYTGKLLDGQVLLALADTDATSPQWRINGLTVTPSSLQVNKVTAAAAAYTEGDSSINLLPSVTVLNPDGTFNGGSLTVTNQNSTFDNDRVEILHSGNSAGQIGVTVTGSDSTGSQGTVRYGGVQIASFTGGRREHPLAITFNTAGGSAVSSSAVQALYRAIQYRNVNGSTLTSGDRTIQFALGDGDGASTTVSRSISIQPNAAPNFDGGATATTYTEDSPPVFLLDTVQIVDTSNDFSGGSLKLSFTQATQFSNDRLAIQPQGTGAGQIGLSGTTVTYAGNTIGTVAGNNTSTGFTVTFTTSYATREAVQALVRRVSFECTNTFNPSSADREVKFELSDGHDGGTRSHTVNVVLSNDAPTISSISNRTTYRGTSTGPISFTIADDVLSGSNLNPTVTSSNPTLVPSSAITLGGSGSSRNLTIVPAANMEGMATITVTVSDGSLSATSSFVLTVVNAPSTASDVTYNVELRTGQQFIVAAPGLLMHANDPDNTLHAKLDEILTDGGYVVVNTDGSFYALPKKVGPFQFTYYVVDPANPNQRSESKLVTINVSNPTPVTVTETYTATSGVNLSVSKVAGVLANDTDANDPHNTLKATLVTGPAGGTFALHADGSLGYMPQSTFHGVTSFTYTVSDGTTTSAPMRSYIAVSNTAPVGNPDTYSVPMNGVVSVSPLGVLQNDTDLDGDTLTAVTFTQPAHGTLIPMGNGGFYYTPYVGYAGSDTFTYRASDGHAASAATVVTVRVLPAVSIASLDKTGSEEGLEPGSFLVTRPGSTTNALTVKYAFLSGVERATHGTDYQSLYSPSASFGTVTIPAGSSTATLGIAPLQDANYEGMEAVDVVLMPDSTYTVSGASAAHLTISDNDIVVPEVGIEGVAWLDPDGDWVAANPNEMLWAEDTLRWEATVSHPTGASLTGTSWYKRPYNSASTWQLIGSSVNNVLDSYTPDVGDWEYKVVAVFAGGDVAESKLKRWAVNDIAETTWTKGDDAQTLEAWPGGMRVFPEATAPGSDAGRRLLDDVKVKVSLSMPVPAGFYADRYIRLFDPDHAYNLPTFTAARATLKETLDPNDLWVIDESDPDNPEGIGTVAETRPNDNRIVVDGIAAPRAGVIGATPAAQSHRFLEGESSFEYVVNIEARQPGNNFKAVSSGRKEWVDKAKFMSDGLSVETQTPTGIRFTFADRMQTPVLTVWRTLHVELDSMKRPMADPTAEVDDLVEADAFPSLLSIDFLSQFERANIRAVDDLDDWDTTDNGEFVHNLDVTSPRLKATADVSTDEEFWAAYLLTSYEGLAESDNDPNGAEHVLAEYVDTTARAAVYLETIRDSRASELARGRTVNVSIDGATRLAVLHEVSHMFIGPHKAGAGHISNTGPLAKMDWAVSGPAFWDTYGFTIQQLDVLQDTVNPIK